MCVHVCIVLLATSIDLIISGNYLHTIRVIILVIMVDNSWQ